MGKQIWTRIPDDVFEWIRTKAAVNYLKFADIVRLILIESMNKDKNNG